MQNIELQDMMSIIHGLRMSGLSFVETDALDEINSRIKDLPSSEALAGVYSDPREVKGLCAEVGRIMELIDHYGNRNEEFKARYNAKTNLPPRYKNLKWKAASKNMKIRTAQEVPEASSEMDAMAQQLKDLESSLLTTQQELTTFSTRINSDLPNLSAQVPAQYQPIFQQYAVVVNEATNELLNKTMMLIQGIQMIQNSTAGVQSVLQENEVMMKQFISNASYIKNIVKLSKNLEGNGIISEKLISYAKNLKDKDIKANYDLLEINALLRNANMDREANTLIKTAGFWDKIKGKKKQNIPAGYELIDSGEQTGSQWETGSLETQFANDVDWLKRSWDNLVDFFGRYVRDANTLVSEWQGRESPEKAAKINELKEQAQVMLNNVQKIQQSPNFTSKLMGNDLFGASEKSEETPSEETPSEETPSEETPSEETPSEETPEESTEELEGVKVGQKYDYSDGTKTHTLEITWFENGKVNFINELGYVGSSSFSDFNKNLQAGTLTENVQEIATEEAQNIDPKMQPSFQKIRDNTQLSNEDLESLISYLTSMEKVSFNLYRRLVTAYTESELIQAKEKLISGHKLNRSEIMLLKIYFLSLKEKNEAQNISIEERIKMSIDENVIKGEGREIKEALMNLKIMGYGQQRQIPMDTLMPLFEFVNNIKAWKNQNKDLIDAWNNKQKKSSSGLKIRKIAKDEVLLNIFTLLDKVINNPLFIITLTDEQLDEIIENLNTLVTSSPQEPKDFIATPPTAGTPPAASATAPPEVFKVGQIWQSKINPNVKFEINEVNIKPGEASLLSITRKSPGESDRSFEKPMSLWLKLVNEGRIELQI
jgi:hypothetical protein